MRRVGRLLFIALTLLVLAVPAFAQDPVETVSPQPVHVGILEGMLGAIGSRLSINAVVGYDFPQGGTEQPWSAGFTGAWKITDRFQLDGSSVYVVNGEGVPLRHSVRISTPIMGGK